MGWSDYDGGWKPYVPVAERRAAAAKEAAKRAKKGEALSPVVIEGRSIATTFWGQAWCTNLEGYSDYENRLPRGRTYARNGSVIDLKIEKGAVKALVMGSELYTVQVDIGPLPGPNWLALKKKCAGLIGSLVELLQGKLSKAVMALVTDRQEGLFPKPKEIKMRCSCPDGAGMCKHVAAALYGVGARLDSAPELLFVLRGADHHELIEEALPAAPSKAAGQGQAPAIATEDLGSIFGIEIAAAPAPAAKAGKKGPAAKKAAVEAAPVVAPKAPAAKKGAVDVRKVVEGPKPVEAPAAKKAAAKAPAAKKPIVAEAPAPAAKVPATKKDQVAVGVRRVVEGPKPVEAPAAKKAGKAKKS